jgi:hypothetical protein
MGEFLKSFLNERLLYEELMLRMKGAKNPFTG